MKDWKSKMINVEEKVIERICDILPIVYTKLSENACTKCEFVNICEDCITENIVLELLNDKYLRNVIYYCESQFSVLSERDSGVYYSKGKLDFAIIFDRDKKIYLGYEAKRLNVNFGEVKHSLATEYVTNGVNRFVTEQYSENLPMGCMLGYVYDKNINDLPKKIEKKLKNPKHKSKLVRGPKLLKVILSAHRFETFHKRKTSKKEICIRHALVPC